MSTDIRLSDSALDQLVELGNSLDTLDIAFDTVYADAQQWEEYRVQYNQLDIVLSSCEKDLRVYDENINNNPQVMDVREKVAAYRAKFSVLVDEDPTHAALLTYSEKIENIIASDRRPLVQARDKALNEKRAYLKWMAQAEQSKFKAAWDRVKKEQA
jgi:hypothetical protein